MPVCRREAALVAFKSVLSEVVDVQSVTRNTTDSVTAVPALIMVDGGQDLDDTRSTTEEDFYVMTVEVWGYDSRAPDDANTGGGAGLGAALSELYAEAVAAVLADDTLGGAVDYVRETDLFDPEFDDETGHRPNASFMIRFEVEFSTVPGDPYTAPA